MSSRPRRLIQAPSTRWAITARSMPREVRRSYAGGSAEGGELERASSRSRLWSVPGIVERAGRWSDGATRVISLYERYLVATIYL